MLSARITAFPGHMGGQRRSKSNLLDTENAPSLFLALVGDKPKQACTPMTLTSAGLPQEVTCKFSRTLRR